MEKTNDFFKFQVGDTKLRVMTEPVPVRQYFKDGKYHYVDDSYRGPEKASVQAWAWCVVRGQGMKIVKFPYSLVKEVQKLMANDEYSFEGFPMPYDLTITATGEGVERRYALTPARKNTDVTEEEKEDLRLKTPIADIIGRIREKAGLPAKKPPVEYPERDEDDEVPF